MLKERELRQAQQLSTDAVAQTSLQDLCFDLELTEARCKGHGKFSSSERELLANGGEAYHKKLSTDNDFASDLSLRPTTVRRQEWSAHEQG
jgi:hypothetical protein